MSKNLFVAARHMDSPFTNKRVLKGQLIETPRVDDKDPDREGKLAEIDRIKKGLLDSGAAEMADTAIGPYNPGEPGSPGATEGIHFNIPPEAEQNIVHDGSIESAERLAQLRKNRQERDAVAARKAEGKAEPTQAELDAQKAAELAKDGPKDEKILEGGEAAKEILKGAETGATTDAPAGDTHFEAPADDKSGKKGKK